jgi:hypothetical protein
MRLALRLPSGTSGEMEEAQRSFHVAAGVDVIKTDAGEVEADWLIESGLDEFWWPRRGSLKAVLAAVPERYGAVEAVVRHFAPIAGDGRFSERMVYRVAPQGPLDHLESPWLPARRIVRRTDAAPRAMLRGWYPIEVLHFPMKSTGGLDAARIEQGLREGALREDTRLRDAFRALEAGSPLVIEPPTAVDDAMLGADLAVLGDADVIRARRRLDELEERLAAVESITSVRLERRVRSLVRRRFPRS